MYSENVKPMTFAEKQALVQKITLLPSQYLRGLMDVISKYQPDTVRQIDDDGYAFDLGQMNENTVWAISDYVKDSMIELDGYIRSISAATVSGDDQGVSLDPAALAAGQQPLLGIHRTSSRSRTPRSLRSRATRIRRSSLSRSRCTPSPR
ncbi:hypothetical protein PINS_up022853 [Pythium insidiosum]|nr:hypothetical protein PINS_up022853 [Pythium insidiosum]